MTALRRRRLGVAAVGLLCGLALILANGGVVGQTMASWSDRVVGGSVFRTSEDAGKAYARAISTHGWLNRLVSVDKFGPIRSFTDAQRPLKFVDSGWVQGEESGTFRVVTAEGQGRSCSRSEIATPNECTPPPSTSLPPRAYAASLANALRITAVGDLGVMMSYGTGTNPTPVAATAACRPGQNGVARLTGGNFNVRGATLPIPPPNGQGSATATSPGFRYDATLRHVRVEGQNQAKSQLWLHASSTGRVTGTVQWRVDMLLVDAECGIGMSTPPEPGLQTASVPMRADVLAAQFAQPDDSSETCIEPTRDEIRVGDTEHKSQALSDDNQNSASDPAAGTVTDSTAERTGDHDAPAGTSCTGETPTVLDVLAQEAVTPEEYAVDPEGGQELSAAAQGTPTPPASTPTSPVSEAATDSTSGTASAEESPEHTTPVDSATPDTPAASPTVTTTSAPPNDTVPAPAPTPGPTEPTSVGVGRPFALVATDGTELGTATVTAVRNEPGCGIAVQMSVRTSSKTDEPQWNTLTSNDFRAILADGSTAGVRPDEGGCDPTRTALPQVLQPATSYAGWLTFGVSPAVSTVMLRPAGTAGWTFAVPAPSPTQAAPTQTQTPPGPGVASEDSTIGDPSASSTADATPTSLDGPSPEPEAG
ncbi:hypothetical protein ACFWB0_25225 [Rhodococcus sp. NPDC060086]|uniref:hypothetical protein n=1 Tax=Rhodococcus sp. NPDC060086 TaxID=3347055 RepID=UPI003667D396